MPTIIKTFNLNLYGVDTQNTKVQFKTDEKGQPYMPVALIIHSDPKGAEYFVVKCGLPEGLPIDRKTSYDIFSVAEDGVISGVVECGVSFDGEASQDAELSIGAFYDRTPETTKGLHANMLKDMENVLLLMGCLCRTYIRKTVTA